MENSIEKPLIAASCMFKATNNQNITQSAFDILKFLNGAKAVMLESKEISRNRLNRSELKRKNEKLKNVSFEYP